MNPKPLIWSEGDQYQNWQLTTIRQFGKDEKFLEKVISDNPSLLGMESLRRKISPPYQVFTQLGIKTLTSRTIQPDIVYLTQSGDVVIVEVKLEDNPELRDRQVISQIVDYTATLATYDKDNLLQLFGKNQNCESWELLIQELFPESPDPLELADQLYSNISNGDIHLIIACDRVPAGLHESILAISRQSALGFELSVVEILPFIKENDGSKELLFIPNMHTKTDIIARTAVTITYQEGIEKPGVQVITSSVDEIEQAVQDSRAGVRRKWDESSFFEDAESKLEPFQIDAVKTLYNLYQKEADTIIWGSGKANGSFSPHFHSIINKSLFSVYSDGILSLNFANVQGLEIESQYKEMVSEIENIHAPSDKGWFQIKPEIWCPHVEKFLGIFQKLIL